MIDMMKDPLVEKNPAALSAKEEFDKFIIEQDHPCIMAQTVFSMGKVDFHEYTGFGSPEAAERILDDLKKYLAGYDFESNEFLTFLAVFRNEENFLEKEFEQLLWRQLEFLHEADDQPWDHRVSLDPENSNFSFSLGGRAFYIVGMHPNSSRLARRSPYPALAFNLHWQFEKLREMNAYTTVRDKIRERDSALQGHINPMLRDFGEASEARQYSGREVGADWKCPFHSKKG